MSNKFWTIISALAAIIAVPVAFWVYYATVRDQSREIEVVVLSKTNLLNPDAGRARDKLKMTYQGKEVRDVSIIRARVKNSGRQPISDSDFEEPIQIVLDGIDDLISAEVVEPQPPSLKMDAEVQNSSKAVTLSKKLLNEGDSFIVEVTSIPAQDKTPRVTSVGGRIKGVKEVILKAEPESATKTKNADVGSIIATIGGMIAIIFKIFLDRLRSEVTVRK